MSPALLRAWSRLRASGGGRVVGFSTMERLAHHVCWLSRIMSAHAEHRAARDELEALRSLLQKATEKVATVDGGSCVNRVNIQSA